MIAGGSVSAADWPQWRGPFGTGATDEKDLPRALERHRERRVEGQPRRRRRVVADCRRQSGVRHVADRRRASAVRARGSRRAPTAPAPNVRSTKASTAAAGDKVFFLVEAFDRANGRRVWEYRMEAVGPLQSVHDKHNLASPSPVTDGQLVYAWFGTGQVVALDMSGQARVAASPRPGDFAVRHQLGPFQLADAVPGHADPVVRSRARVVSARRRQEDRQGSLESRPRQGPLVVHHAVRRAGRQRSRARRQLERARRRLRPEERHVPVARRRIESVSDSGADIRQRRDLPDARLSKRSLHGRQAGRPRRRVGVARRVGGARPVRPTFRRSSTTAVCSTWRATSARSR